MMGDYHVRFCESLGVKFPGSTRQQLSLARDEEGIMVLFADRTAAGRELAKKVAPLVKGRDCVVVALPRGGVPVAVPIAQALSAPLDILIVRKIGAPGNEELAIGAVASGGATFLNRDLIERLNIRHELVEAIKQRELEELHRRENAYNIRHTDLLGKLAILVDDGLATGATMKASIFAAKQLGAQLVVVAVPVAPPGVIRELTEQDPSRTIGVALFEPTLFDCVGSFYDRFPQLSDEEVRELLRCESAPA